jgi:SOS-response transcriptional repressor LexA
MLTGKELGIALETAIKLKNVTKKAVADEFGVKPPSVQDWIKYGRIDKKHLNHLVAYFSDVVEPAHWGIENAWQFDSRPSPEHRAQEPSPRTYISNVEETTEEYRASQRRAPVISWVQAGEWQSVEDPFEPGTADEWEIIPASAGPNSFWLRVIGDSMTAPSGVSVPEGMLILVDPDYPALSGRLVVAKLTDSQQVTFKKYVEDAGRKYLKPLNPSYSMLEINGNCRIIGGVREAKVKL